MPVAEAPPAIAEEAPVPRSAEAKATPILPKFKAVPSELRWRTGERERGGSRWIILGLLTAAGLVLLGYVAGRGNVVAADGSQASEAAVANSWRDGDAAQLRKAHAAERAGDLPAALRLLNDLSKTTALDPLVQAFRGSLNSRLGSFNDAESDLARSVSASSPPGARATIEAARAFNFVRWRRFTSAVPCFQAVAQVDPANVPNLLNWAETLRRIGSLTEAIDKFSEAIARLDVNATAYAEPQREYIDFARRLSLIEVGRGGELQAEINGRLAAPAPSGYWLLTAAAQALQKGDVPAAADALGKARAVLAPEQFRSLLGDYFFRSFSQHAEIDPFLYSSTPEERKARAMSMNYFLDP